MNNKPWYEKIGIWIGIIASICTILAFAYSLNSSHNTNSNTTTSNDNEINTGDQSAIIVGDNNTIQYTYNNPNSSQDSQSNDLPASKENDLSVIASHQINPIQSSEEGIDVLVTAITSFPAEHVTISAISDEDNEKTTFDMYGSAYNWYFNANFYIEGTYTVTITAYSSDGQSTYDTFEYLY